MIGDAAELLAAMEAAEVPYRMDGFTAKTIAERFGLPWIYKGNDEMWFRDDLARELARRWRNKEQTKREKENKG